jgi:hypothetical protein
VSGWARGEARRGERRTQQQCTEEAGERHVQQQRTEEEAGTSGWARGEASDTRQRRWA